MNTSDAEEHCTICLQPFLDRAIIPVCAHEFCFECILLWSEQSRKCPLCSRSFEDSYLIHHIRSQFDYQKHYLPPPRSSTPPPPLTGDSYTNALRHTRRERQWGRRQRRQREEADQLDRAIARRRWIYQHHLYAKHVASNPYTRYRPFPTPAQFAASPDLISRMTVFLRRELRAWPNLDVEFLTTYTISLMKSIDIRSESAVKLLSEFLDLDTPYAAGERHANAEHFAHEIYSYLRSPYRDLNIYDQTAQYDSPSEISPPQEMERGSRWSVEPSPSRRSRSRSSPPLMPLRETERALATNRGDNSAEAAGPSRRHSPSHSPRNEPPAVAVDHFDGVVHGVWCNDRPHNDEISRPDSTPFNTKRRHNNFPISSCSPSDGKGKGREIGQLVSVTDNTKLGTHADDIDSATAPTAGKPGVAPPGSEDMADDVRDVGDSMAKSSSSANPRTLRKRPNGHIPPRNRTLSESVQAYLSAKPTAARRRTSKKFLSEVNGQPARTNDVSATARPSQPTLLFRVSDGPKEAAGPDVGYSSSSEMLSHTPWHSG